MKIRNINPNDIFQLRIIHDKFFRDEFEFPDFLNGYLSSFVVTDDDGEIIVGGGVRRIAEAVLITNKDYSTRDRKFALLEALRASMLTTSIHNFDQLHAFVQDKNWIKHLKKVGFSETKGQALVLNI